jgi:hypothetical protein
MTPREVADRFDAKPTGDGEWKARCPGPSHKRRDRNPSLTIGTGDNGHVLMKCFGGCDTAEVLATQGLTLADLMPAKQSRGRGEGGATPRRHRAQAHTPPSQSEGMGTEGVQGPDHTSAQVHTPPAQPDAGQKAEAAAASDEAVSEGCTLVAYAAAKRLPPSSLRMFGLSEITYQNAPAVRIPYRDRAGLDRSVRFRVEVAKRPDGTDNRFRWKSGSKMLLYGLWRLDAERDKKQSAIALVEGESDCHTLWYHGFPAVGIPGAANWSEQRDAAHLDGFDTIYVVVEPDTGGEAVKAWLASSHIRERVRLVQLGGQHKDPSALYLADPEHFKERWQAALDAAVPWSEQEAHEQEAQRDSAWSACADLAQREEILEDFTTAITADGVVGEGRTVQLLYLAVTSRLLDSVVSLILKGPSSSGKSYTTERVLRYFPDAAYYALSAMSDRTLAYSDEPIAHRMLVFYEAAGIHGDFATYLLRTLLSEGCVRYETVEKTPEGLRPRLIVRQGPAARSLPRPRYNCMPRTRRACCRCPSPIRKTRRRAF